MEFNLHSLVEIRPYIDQNTDLVNSWDNVDLRKQDFQILDAKV